MAAELATAAKSGSVTELVASGVFTSIGAALADAKNANAREGGLLAIAALAGSVGRPAEPYLMPLLGHVLNLLSDKGAPVRTAAASAQVSEPHKGALDTHSGYMYTLSSLNSLSART